MGLSKRDVSVSSCIASSFARSRCRSVGDVWWRVAHVWLGINPNNRWYMIVLRTFQKCSILLPGFDELVRNLSKLFRMSRKWSIYRWSAYRVKFCPKFHQSGDGNKANTGARCLHITTRNGTSENRPRPKIINTGKRWVFLKLHHTVLLRYDPSGIKWTYQTLSWSHHTSCQNFCVRHYVS